MTYRTGVAYAKQATMKQEVKFITFYKFYVTVKIEDKTHDFAIVNIGERRLCISEDKYTKEEQCLARAEYELDQVKNLVNIFTISCVPIYLINDVNRVVIVKDNNKIYKCLVDKVDIPLSYDGLMSLTCHEIFV